MRLTRAVLKTCGRMMVAGFFVMIFFCIHSPLEEHAQTRNQPQRSTNADWKPLFDGKTLTGWKASAEGYFTVEEGAITGKVASEYNGPITRIVSSEDEELPYPYLVWHGGDITDFNLRFKVRLMGDGAHVGVHFRSAINGQKLAAGYQADVPELGGYFKGLVGKRPFENFASGGQRNLINNAGEKTVTFFGEEEGILKDIDFRQWVTYEIQTCGPRVVLEINDRKVLELIDQRIFNAPRSGVLAISLHPFRGIEVQLKDIELKELSPSLDDRRTISQSVQSINLIEALRTAIETKAEQKALQLLQHNPLLSRTVFAEKKYATERSSRQMTPLLYASAYGQVEVVRWLIANGAIVNQEGYNKFLPIHLAANAETA